MTSLLQKARQRLAEAQDISAKNAAEEAAAEAERIAEARAVQAVIDAKRAADQEIADQVAEAASAVAQIEAQIEHERIEALRAETALQLARTWELGDSEAARIAAAPPGVRQLAVRASMAMRSALDVICPDELWKIESPNLATLSLGGYEFWVKAIVPEAASAAAGFRWVYQLQWKSPSGWTSISSPSDFTTLSTQFPDMRPAA